MKIKDLLISVSRLVSEREIIDHGSIRCLLTQESVDSICSAEDVDEVDTGIIGDNDLADRLRDLAEDAGDLHLDDVNALERAYKGDDIESYISPDEEDELCRLDKLIQAAKAL